MPKDELGYNTGKKKHINFMGGGGGGVVVAQLRMATRIL